MQRISTFAFTLARHERPNGTVLLVLTGELDVSVSVEARDLAEVELNAGRDLELDLSGLGFVDSSGLFMLLRASELAETLGRQMTVIGPLQNQVRRTLRLSGLDRLLPAD
jgi:anti-anti-sigma factor